MKQVVRIIGGIYRGKKIQFPAVAGLRPTSDRVKETVFNWLMHDIRGSRCLDAFAGSGSLGLEAFSRGAAQVTFIEQSKEAYVNLQKILQSFDNPKLQLIHEDANQFLKNNSQAFDIVFLDPPFALNYLPECLDTLFKNNNLIKNGLVYVESPQLIEVNEMQWQILKSKQTGQIFYCLLKKL